MEIKERVIVNLSRKTILINNKRRKRNKLIILIYPLRSAKSEEFWK